MAGGLRLAGAPARVANFEYVAQPEEAAAVRRIAFAPGLDFNAVVSGVLEGEGTAEEEAEEEEPDGAEEGQLAEAQELGRPSSSSRAGLTTTLHEGALIAMLHLLHLRGPPVVGKASSCGESLATCQLLCNRSWVWSSAGPRRTHLLVQDSLCPRPSRQSSSCPE